MRIISQDGTIDIPYDCFSLSVASGKYKDVEYGCIYCHNISSPHGTKLAEYSSKEKAYKAMEMLRERYSNSDLCKDDIQFRAETMIEDANSAIAKFMVDITYFRLPQDSEVEV